MELKVRVDGILRVVCGVTENSTCQDVVIALAHAMGKTGRFTLVEKWRENERPLLPEECPVKILQKWGEYATEVQLLLNHSDKQKTDIPYKEKFKENEKPKINFTSAPRDAGIRRSLTFSGAHSVVTEGARPRQRHLQTSQSIEKCETSSTSSQRILPRQKQPEQIYGVGVRLKATQGREPVPNIEPLHSHPSVNNPNLDLRVHNNSQGRNVSPRERTLTKPNSSVIPHAGPRMQQVQHRTEHQRIASPYNAPMIGGTQSNSTNHPLTHPQYSGVSNAHGNLDPGTRNHGDTGTRNSILPRVNSPISRPSAFQPVPQKQWSDRLDLTQPVIDNLPVYRARPVNCDLEEYDLDSNFPDVLKSSRQDVIIEEYTMPDDQHGGFVGVKEVVEPDTQLVKMQRVLSQQQERIRMQESQIQLIDTELVSLEDADRQRLDQKHSIGEEISRLQQNYNQNEAEVVQLAAVSWVDVINAEKSREKSYSSDMSLIQEKIEYCTKDLAVNKDKISELDKQVTSEKQALEEIVEEQEREITQIGKEMEGMNAEIETEVKTYEFESECLSEVEEDLKVLDSKKVSQQSEVNTLEQQIKDVNMQDLELVGKAEKSGQNGKAVLQALAGRMSPRPGLGGRKYIASPLSKVLAVSKNPNGVWV